MPMSDLEKLAEEALKHMQGDWQYNFSPSCRSKHGVMDVRKGEGATSVCSSPWTHPGAEPTMRFIAAANPRVVIDLLAELARVRGLLQRLMETAARYDAFGDNSFAFRTTVNEARQVLQSGAESADIGKLDRVDKSDG